MIELFMILFPFVVMLALGSINHRLWQLIVLQRQQNELIQGLFEASPEQQDRSVGSS